MGRGFIADVEALEEHLKKEIGESVIMYLCLEDYKQDGIDENILKDIYRAQIDLTERRIQLIEDEKDRLKKKAYAEKISYVDVQDTMSIVTRGVAYLKEEKERYKSLVRGVR